MTEMQRDLLEHQLTRDEVIALKNKRTGLFLFQLSWILVFVCLIFVNWQLRYSYESWPPPGVAKMGLGLPSIATLLLAASAFMARGALRAAENRLAADFLARWRLVLVLGGVFVAMMSYEWLIAPMGTQYGTLFRVMTAFHAVHALVIGLYMFSIYRTAAQQPDDDTAQRLWAVEAGAKMWYFVAVAWFMFYLVLYWL